MQSLADILANVKRQGDVEIDQQGLLRRFVAGLGGPDEMIAEFCQDYKALEPGDSQRVRLALAMLDMTGKAFEKDVDLALVSNEVLEAEYQRELKRVKEPPQE